MNALSLSSLISKLRVNNGFNIEIPSELMLSDIRMRFKLVDAPKTWLRDQWNIAPDNKPLSGLIMLDNDIVVNGKLFLDNSDVVELNMMSETSS